MSCFVVIGFIWLCVVKEIVGTLKRWNVGRLKAIREKKKSVGTLLKKSLACWNVETLERWHVGTLRVKNKEKKWERLKLGKRKEEEL